MRLFIFLQGVCLLITLQCLGQIEGCTDITACNYNFFAFEDDGSCVYPGCTDPEACNFDPNTDPIFNLCNSGSCSTFLHPCAPFCADPNTLEGLDFLGLYNAFNWTQNFVSFGGEIKHTIGSLSIVSSEDLISPSGNTSISINAIANGNISFDWEYYTVSEIMQFSEVYFAIDGVEQILSNPLLSYDFGSDTFFVSAGQTMTFGINIDFPLEDGVKFLITNFRYTIGTCGCTDPLACNFNPSATIDDNSCQASGCLDQTACNFNPAATCDSPTSCIFPDGCTNVLACNYNPASICDDGTCIMPDGCTNPLACNFSPFASCDDGNCILPDGCTDPIACNFNPAALCDDGTCTPGDGCTDPNASNFSPFAICDDGSCCYTVTVDYTFNSNFGEIFDIWTLNAFDPGSGAITELDIFSTTQTPESGSVAYCLTEGCYQFVPQIPAPIWTMTWSLSGNEITDVSGGLGDTILFSVNSALCGPFGCTNPLACNFDPLAADDDGTCATDSGCTDPLACNFDPSIVCDDGSCCFDNCLILTTADSFGDGWNGATYDISDLDGNIVLSGTHPAGFIITTNIICLPDGCYTIDVGGGSFDAEIAWAISGVNEGGISGLAPVADIEFSAGAIGCPKFGCVDETACNFDPDATDDDGTCIPSGCTNNLACNFNSLAGCDNGTCSFEEGCTDVFALNFDDQAICNDGSCIYEDGCTDSSAVNYNPSALTDDGTCIIVGCTNPDDLNFDPAAMFDDGSCDSQPGNACPGDFNNDQQIDTVDLLGFLGVFGSNCI